MALPKVSHFIITYNQREYIEQALQSAVDQDYPELEIVVADDGSVDGTAEIVADFALRYPGKVIPSLAESNGGITSNCNRALALCSGKYISCQGGDDILLPGKISHQVQWLEADERRVMCGHDVRVFFTSLDGSEHVRGSGRAGRSGIGAGKIIQGGVGSFFMGTSLMWRASATPPGGFDTRIPISSDWKFIIDVVGLDGVWGAVDGVYALYRIHPQNISSTKRDSIIMETLRTFVYLRQQYPAFRSELNLARREIFYNVAKVYYRNHSFGRARRVFRALLGTEGSGSWGQKARVLKYLFKCRRRSGGAI